MVAGWVGTSSTGRLTQESGQEKKGGNEIDKHKYDRDPGHRSRDLREGRQGFGSPTRRKGKGRRVGTGPTHC